MDYLTGTSAKALAEREQLSHQRIYQLLNKVAYRVLGYTSIKAVKALDPTRFVEVLHDRMMNGMRYIEPGRAETPEEFFYEMLTERKTRSYK